MFETLNTKIADRIVGCLQSTGEEGRARKIVTRYRKNPNEADAAEAVAALNGLNQNKLSELKQAARI